MAGGAGVAGVAGVACLGGAGGVAGAAGAAGAAGTAGAADAGGATGAAGAAGVVSAVGSAAAPGRCSWCGHEEHPITRVHYEVSEAQGLRVKRFNLGRPLVDESEHRSPHFVGFLWRTRCVVDAVQSRRHG